MRRVLLSWLIMTTLLTTGCEALGGGLVVVNETDKTLYIFDTPIRLGGTWLFSAQDCSNFDLTLRNKTGTVIAELTEEWCPDQTWTVTDKGQSELTDQ